MLNPATHSGRRAARDFLRRIREVYKLVAAVDLGDAWLGSDQLIVGHRVARYPHVGQPALLSNGMYLNVQMTLRVDHSTDAGPPRLQTLRSTYRYQAGHDVDDPKPIFVYEYNRNAPPLYPRCHLHVFATPDHYPLERPFPRLHLPTRRITLEQIVWHLIHEHGVHPAAPTGITSSGATKPTTATPNATPPGPTTRRSDHLEPTETQPPVAPYVDGETPTPRLHGGSTIVQGISAYEGIYSPPTAARYLLAAHG